MKSLSHYYNTIRTKLGIPTIVKNGGFEFYCPTFYECWLAENYFLKDPETMAWIDSFHQHSVFWDFGANIGAYSIYAAKKGHSVVCFEPSDREYEILKRNIELNHVWAMTQKIFADDKTDYSEFPLPDYIKIDVDGPEIKVIRGLKYILPEVKELSIELEPMQRDKIITLMKEYSFVIKSEGISKMFMGTQYEGYSNAIFI